VEAALAFTQGAQLSGTAAEHLHFLVVVFVDHRGCGENAHAVSALNATGHLSAGAEADIAVLELQDGNFGFVDSGRARMNGSQRLECRLTLRRGEVVWDRDGLSRPSWEDLGDYRRAD